MSASAPAPSVARWQSGVMLTVAAAVVVHSAIVGLWLSPTSPIRESIGDDKLASYVNPYFRQDPMAMDPAMQRADEAMRVRAKVLTREGEEIATDWIDVTEVQMADMGLFASRASLSARSLATNLNVAVVPLPGEAKDVVAQDLPDAEIETRMRELQAAGATPYTTRVLFANWSMAARFATLFVGAAEDGTVEQVQIKVGLRRVPPYDERHDTKLADVDFDWVTLGWREAQAGNPQAQRGFDDYVDGRL
ncbi:MAG: DUF5819 family protein [Aeromicrobium sp.]|uniref:DUF5819 family protein n=1 Tax=Aeromicrobium sp. TaxID=1871063 RepID=UPI0039E5685C